MMMQFAHILFQRDAVKADVADFVGDAPQFDDITMLYLKYNGGGEK